MGRALLHGRPAGLAAMETHEERRREVGEVKGRGRRAQPPSRARRREECGGRGAGQEGERVGGEEEVRGRQRLEELLLVATDVVAASFLLEVEPPGRCRRQRRCGRRRRFAMEARG